MKRLNATIFFLFAMIVGCETHQTYKALTVEQMMKHDYFPMPLIESNESVIIKFLQLTDKEEKSKDKYSAHVIYKYDLSDATEALINESSEKNGAYDVGIKLTKDSEENIARFIEEYKDKRIRIYVDSEVSLDMPFAGNKYVGVVPLLLNLKKKDAEEVAAKINNFLLHKS